MKRRIDLLAIILIFVIAVLFCGRAVFTGRVLMPLDMLLLMSPWHEHIPEVAPDFMMPQNPMLDPVQQYYPWRMFAVDSLKSGIIPLWNPYSYCGQPFLANLQSAIFYPLNLIFLILPIGATFTWGAVLHLFLAGIFMYLLLRQWQLHPLAGLFGAVAFMLNGYIIGWLEYPAFGQWVIIWLPAVLLCYEKSLSSQRWLWSILTGVVIGIQFLGGQLQISGYLLLTFMLYVLWRALSVRDRKEMGLRVAGASAALLLGFSLAAVQLLPTLELVPLCARPQSTLAAVTQSALPVTHLILYFIPNFFGNPKLFEPGQSFEPVGYWGDLLGKYSINFFETGCYVGIPTLLLAWLSLRLWRRPVVSFLIAITVFSVLLAIGSPVFSVLFYIAPGMKQLAGLARVLCITAFGLTGLAAIGLDRVIVISSRAKGEKQEAAKSKNRRGGILQIPPIADTAERDYPALHWGEMLSFLALSLIAVSLAWVTFSNILVANPPLLDNFRVQVWRFNLLLLLSYAGIRLLVPRKITKLRERQTWIQLPVRNNVLASLILLLLLADLFSFGYKFNPATDPKLAFFPTRTTDLLQEKVGHNRIAPYRSSNASPQAALRWMLPNTPLAYKLRDVHGYDSLVPDSYSRLMGFTDWSKQGSWPPLDSPLADLLAIEYAVTIDELHAPGWELLESAEANIYRNTEVLPRAYAAKQRLFTAGNGEAEFTEDGINKIELQATLPSDGYIVLTDTAYPGWKALVDGKPAPWEVAHSTFRAAPVPAGRHTIKWSYEPATFKVGLFISLTSLAVVFGLLISMQVGRFSTIQNTGFSHEQNSSKSLY